MTPEKNQQLLEEFPGLFDMWRNQFETQDGWFDLIRELSTRVQEIINNVPGEQRFQTRVAQVKEKFGGLRYYMSYGEFFPREARDRIEALIRVAEDKSFHTCEICGHDGQLTKRSPESSWVQTLCKEHKK